MIDFKKLEKWEKEKFLTPATLEEISVEAERMIFYSLPFLNEAWQLARILEDKLELSKIVSPSEIEQEYIKMAAKLRFAALPMLTDSEVIELFKKHLKEGLEIEDFDLREKLRVALMRLPIFERDDFKKQIIQAMKGNTQLITSKKLRVREREEKPTIGVWLIDYDSSLGFGRIDVLKQAEYFSKSANFQALSKEEREKVKKLFSLYEFLKLSSTTPWGIEEGESTLILSEDGRYQKISGGLLVDITTVEGIPLRKVTSVEEETKSIPEVRPPTKVPKPILGGRDLKIKEIEKQLERKDLSAIERKYLEEELEELRS